MVKESLETGNASTVARKYDIRPSVVGRCVREHKSSPISKMAKKVVGSNNADLLKTAKKSKI